MHLAMDVSELMLFDYHGTAALINFDNRSFPVKVHSEKKRNQKTLDGKE